MLSVSFWDRAMGVVSSFYRGKQVLEDLLKNAGTSVMAIPRIITMTNMFVSIFLVFGDIRYFI